jgi:protein O-mannosyl-transferase
MWRLCILSIMRIKELAILLALAGLLTYLPSFFGGFVWDDEDFVYNNTYVAQGAIGKFFTENALAGAGKSSNYYRPVQFTIYSLLYQLAGPQPWMFHAANIALHGAAGIAAFFLLKHITADTRVSFFAALLFMIHPIQTESVSYISGMSDALYAVFFLCSLILYMKNTAHNQYKPLSVVLFAISLLSKELALIFPGFILILILSKPQETWKRALGIWGIYAGIALLYLLSRLTFLQFADIKQAWAGTLYGEHFTVRLATFFRSFFVYLRLLMYPATLHMERDLTEQVVPSLFSIWTLLFFLFVFVSVALLVRHRIKHPRSASLPLFLMFLVSLTPYTGIFLLNGMFYEHYLYLPMLFFWGFIFSILAPVLHKRVSLVVLTGILILFTTRSWVRQWDWMEPERFYRQTLSFAPNSLRIVNGLGMAQAEKGDCRQAIETYKTAIRLDPRVPNPYHNIANCHAQLGAYGEAEKYYLQAIKTSPRFHFSYLSLIKLYLATGQKQKAKAFLQTALAQFPEADDLKQLYIQL